MPTALSRRSALASLSALAARLRAAQPKLRISLAEWSFHKAIESRLMTNLDFPRIAREQFNIEGLEFVNGLWEAPTQGYVQRLKSNMEKTGTKAVLIMCDDEGAMGHSDRAQRMQAAMNHRKWVDIAAELGCHSIRTNMYPASEPTTPQQIDEFIKYCAESFTDLCGYARTHNLNVIIENHGGISSHADVVVRLMKTVNLPNFGTLPDFGNFPKEIDRYDAIAKLIPYAKGCSFKCFDFDANGKETTMDMDRIMKIVLDSGYHSWIGIEYEGERQSEFEGVMAAKRYLDRVLA
jgi:sugar phosphate isomerase/epimerase